MPMEDISKPTADISDLGALEKEVPQETGDEYEKHQNATAKEVVGNFVIGDIIGKGGFATVCKGLNLNTGEVVAVKKFERAKISPQQIGSVMYEVELLQRLTHENIVHILGKEEGERYLYLFMEYMENGSMRGLLQSFGAFPEQLVAQFMEQVLNGLIYLHDAGVVHRDIKAANILLNRNCVKLADFGVAAELNENDRRYSVVGTPYWMAPEVIEITGHSLASDIWSIGCVVIEMVTGKPPYFHLNPMSAMFRIVQDQLPPLPKGISKDLESFLKSCFQKDPTHRLTARELLVHPWITHRATNGPIATSHEQIRTIVNRPAERRDSDTAEQTIVHRSARSYEGFSATALTGGDEDPALSRASSFSDSTDSRNSDCSDCAKLKRALSEEKTKRQEILLTAINYIASTDAVREGQEPEAQREFRDGLRAMLEEEFRLAFPDDNMPRFMQRRLTICNDQLPHIPPTDTKPQEKDKDKKKREREEKERKEREEKEKKEREEREKKEKKERERLKKRESSFLNLKDRGTKDKEAAQKEKEKNLAAAKKDKEHKEKEKEKKDHKEKDKDHKEKDHKDKDHKDKDHKDKDHKDKEKDHKDKDHKDKDHKDKDKDHKEKDHKDKDHKDKDKDHKDKDKDKEKDKDKDKDKDKEKDNEKGGEKEKDKEKEKEKDKDHKDKDHKDKDKEKDKEKEKEKEKEKDGTPKDKSWFSARRPKTNSNSSLVGSDGE